MESPLHKITDGQFQLVYNALSFTMASMMASTLFFWLRLGSVHEKYKSAMVITGMVTFIAAYHYWRIFNSWDEAFTYTCTNYKGDGVIPAPMMTGKPFNDAYRYMDWLLTVPLLLIEIVFVMDLEPAETATKASLHGVSSALMIIIGYPGELILDSDKLSGRWAYWAVAMVPFAFVVYTLLVGLKGATQAEPDEEIRSKIYGAQWMTVISWLTYPIVYIIPMLGAKGANAVVGIQIGYCISDIISKCGVGLLIYGITMAKSKKQDRLPLVQN
jgi:bacteriorhodopsin